MALEPNELNSAALFTELWESLIESTRQTRWELGEVYKRIEARAKEDPVRAMAWAGATGFVLGGGLLSRLTLRAASAAVTIGLRAGSVGLLVRGLLAVAPLVERVPTVEVGRPS
jgi:hypothetical protein